MRTQEYIGGHRIEASPKDIVAAWYRHSRVDARYALGTGLHETDYALNELDTEESGYKSMGLYQISYDEMVHVGMYRADPYDLEECTIVFAKLTDERAKAIHDAVKHNWSQSESDSYRAYLSIAHNQGLAACLKTIKLYGMDWSSYKSRNEEEALKKLTAAQQITDTVERHKAVADAQEKLRWWYKVFRYGDDCISGGPQWDKQQFGTLLVT